MCGSVLGIFSSPQTTAFTTKIKTILDADSYYFFRTFCEQLVDTVARLLFGKTHVPKQSSTRHVSHMFTRHLYGRLFRLHFASTMVTGICE